MQTQPGFLCKERKQTLNAAWLMVMMTYGMKDSRESLAKWYGNEIPSLLTNGQMQRAGVNNNFRLHSFTFRRMWKQRLHLCTAVTVESLHLHSAQIRTLTLSGGYEPLGILCV